MYATENSTFSTQFTKILKESSRLTQNEKYSDSVNYLLKEGFSISKDSFYKQILADDDFKNSSEQIILEIKNQSQKLTKSDFINSFKNKLNDFVISVDKNDFSSAQKNLQNLESDFLEYAKIRNSLIDDAKNLKNLFKNKSNLDFTEKNASYFFYIYFSLLGTDLINDSGIVGALDSQWYSFVENARRILTITIENYSNLYLEILKDNSILAKNKVLKSDDFVKNIKNYASIEIKILSFYDYLKSENGGNVYNPFSDFFVVANYISNLSEQLKNAYESESKLESIKNEIISNLKENSTEKDESKKQNNVSKIVDLSNLAKSEVGEKSERELENFLWAKDYNNSGYKPFFEISENYKNEINKVFEISSSLFNDVWNQITQNSQTQTENRVLSLKRYNENAKIYEDGFLEKLDLETQKKLFSDVEIAATYDLKNLLNKNLNENSENEYHYKYANLAYKVSSFAEAAANNFIKETNSLKNEIFNYYNEFPQWKNDEKISAYANECVLYLKNQEKTLTDLKNQSSNLKNLSYKEFLQAESAKNEGDFRFSEAEDALKNKNYTLARKKIQESLSKYEESLSFSNDEELSAFWNKKIQEFGNKINSAENEIVVKEVRALKNQAREFYLAGDFDNAEKYLNQAKARWATTNSIEDEEISSLLNFVNVAISMQTGREIKSSEPQYPEMSQLLNLATKYFESGKKKYEDGNVNSGNKDFENALNCIQKVQYVYPLSQEASVLSLKIRQIQNPTRFEQEFAQNIKSAQDMCKNSETLKDGYSNLLDYYAIKPDYKGLKEIIYQVEIDIGIRQKPVDNSDKKRAKDLLSTAKNQFKNSENDFSKLQDALETVDKSLKLNANDEDAKKLKDSIIIKMGGTATSSLSIDDERLYNEAIQAMQNNNIRRANQIITELLQKPENQYSKKIKELKVKIEARM